MGFDYKEKLNATLLHCENLNLGSKVYKKKKRQSSYYTIPLLNIGNNILY